MKNESGYCHSRNNSSIARTGGLLTSHRFSIAEIENDDLRVKNGSGDLTRSIVEKDSSHSFRGHDSSGAESVCIEVIEDMPGYASQEMYPYNFKEFGTSVSITDQ